MRYLLLVCYSILLPLRKINDSDMGRPRKQTKAKEPVRIRKRRISNGNESLYLDIYVDGVRKYEFLKMYLVPEKTPVDKIRNENTMQAVNAIKSKRILEITNGKAGMAKRRAGDKIRLDGFISAYATKKKEQGHNVTSYYALHIMKYFSDMGHYPMMSEIDKAYCLRFIDYLKHTNLSRNTQSMSLRMFGGILNDAVKNDIIEVNPLTKIDDADKIKPAPTQREFLSVDEVQRLIDTPCRSENVKRTFLFSCFCGLRKSDISALKWKDIRERGNGCVLRLMMQKTGNEVIIPLSSDALRWLPERGDNPDDANVFKEVKRNDSEILKAWAKSAGINKNVYYHAARHTFATMLITFGADLYTVSKLLGHTDIKVTQIYAKLVDAKKVEAVELFNGKFR